MSGIAVDLRPLGEPDGLAPHWRALEREAGGSVFTGWHWIGPWLRVLAVRPWLLRARIGRDVAGLAVLCPRTLVRRLFPVRALFLHATGDPTRDAITVEYNDLLVRREDAAAIRRAMLDALFEARRPRFAELWMPGLAAETVPAPRAAILRVHARHGSARVDLAALQGAYLDSLAPRVRRAIRRAVRLYRERGPLVLEAAPDVDTALAWLDALARLHVAKWEARGGRSVFADGAALRFHRELVAGAHAEGGAELLRLSAGGEAVGFLYLLRRCGHVFFYAGGFVFERDNRLKPGLVMHALAVEHCRARGDRVYDFGAGLEPYKLDLGTPGPEIVTAVLARPTVLLRVEDRLRQLRARLRSTGAAATGA